MAYEAELQVAMAATLAAAKLCQKVQAEIPKALEKKDRTPVTIADYGSQALICRAIAAAFPNDAIVGEEDAVALRSAEQADTLVHVAQQVRELVPDAGTQDVLNWIDRGNGTVGDRFWTLDPIDGTKGFLRGEQYAIALALVEAGEIKVGVLGCPNLTEDIETGAGTRGLLFLAVRGKGAQLLPFGSQAARPIRVVDPDDAANLRFVESVESAHGDPARQAAIAKAAGIASPSLRIDSQCKYGAVASGQAALYLRLPSPKTPGYRENIWDHAAGAIVVEEAGGRVTDMFGEPLEWHKGAKMLNNQGVVVSNGPIHDAVISALGI
ncbi:3'(2'),5'-bisphosphate nucleotidase, HAL2 family [Rubidibacter lacunae KORDI 51-2]|uniref:3'(2'),5'-bisphosphate nucleotidase, HAL2 family n=1 Tax=Rubidibacter lacunae KORDI 51-2 TaxID=582515 RepID=U5DI66_9CHRO|nr:3'(2'),5'-bisphosphate nucleotidase [Rubidibacter lacunae]ERN40294.1 3'(2'),5'-bisphosphate nucleotidase, HAL2 family [Rubidibacter lacunae KORDI 51-2]